MIRRIASAVAVACAGGCAYRPDLRSYRDNLSRFARSACPKAAHWLASEARLVARTGIDDRAGTINNAVCHPVGWPSG